MDRNLWLITVLIRSRVDGPNDLVSRLDLQAHGKAQREYQRGYQLLLKKQFQQALEHLSMATFLYPNFVSAHNAIGTTYLALGANQQARAEFARAVELDNHLPASHFHLGCAELALGHYAAAEQALQRAANIAPVDVDLLTALAFADYMNGHFAETIETARRVHRQKHDGNAMVHFFAASAWEELKNFSQAEQQLEMLFQEDPQSPAAPEARQMMARLKYEVWQPPSTDSSDTLLARIPAEIVRAPTQLPVLGEKFVPQSREGASEDKPKDADSYDRCFPLHGAGLTANPLSADSLSQAFASHNDDPLFRASANEVEVFFSATDHGKPVTDLSAKDLNISDNHRPPAAITSLRNESELPLRVALVIDTSDSVSYRFKFEKNIAADFLRGVATGPNDLAFVVGFSNTVLLVQDFTGDHKLVGRSVSQLADSGSTALWDAVDFAIGKLAGRAECHPVARILLVISDGEDNSSKISLDQAINHAEQAQVSIYTLSTREPMNQSFTALTGERALKRLADLTGGAFLDLGSIHGRKNGLTLQQVIRNRFFVSYKPDRFKRNGEFRPIDITAEKDGHKLRVYARKGYFAAITPDSDHF